MAKVNDPRQIFKAARENKSLICEQFLSSDELSNPLEMHGPYSRFAITLLINKEGKYVPYQAPLSPKEVPYLFERIKKLIGTTCSSEESTGNLSLAYTKRFLFGKLKGKTPADVLLDKTINGHEELKSQREFLAQKAREYKANQELVDAIDDAIDLYLNGTLEKKDLPKTSEETLFDSEWRPKRSSKDNKGFYDCRRLEIVFCPQMKQPYRIQISTMKAPLKSEGDGVNPVAADMGTGLATASFQMTEREAFSLFERMQSVKALFENAIFLSCWKSCIEIEKAAREAAK